MKNYLVIIFIGLIMLSCQNKAQDTSAVENSTITFTKTELKNKIKGGWAGQTIGVTYGGPTEFQYRGTFIQDYVPIEWYDNIMVDWYENRAGLYDDIYMDLTFVDVFERLGLEAPADSFALAFANAEYPLWHANQAARYNILNGIMPPESGHYKNNPHADCIDFQIEADFAGLMAPGMVNTATEICDKIGHIMNYGDGWYGGVYVAAMYALAFQSDDIHYVVTEALKTIPEESKFHQTIMDVIQWYQQYPDDWKKTWFEVERKWAKDVGCPDGVFTAFNIDATVNSAYVVIGLLYGDKDFEKTMEISTRCGQDSDCNPATAAGILGTMIGYDAIPEVWKTALYKVEDMDFKYTEISLNDVYDMSYDHAVALIQENGGSVNDQIVLAVQVPKVVKFEQGFNDVYPVERRALLFQDREVRAGGEFNFEFEGNGFVVTGWSKGKSSSIVNTGELYINDELVETVNLPVDFTKRRHELFWKYDMPSGKYNVKIKLKNSDAESFLSIGDILIYQEK